MSFADLNSTSPEPRARPIAQFIILYFPGYGLCATTDCAPVLEVDLKDASGCRSLFRGGFLFVVHGTVILCGGFPT